MIKSETGITDIDVPLEYTFSYVTDEEMFIIDQLIEKDKTNMVIPEATKNKLSGLDRVVVTNDLRSGVNADSLEIYRSTMDLPKGEEMFEKPEIRKSTRI